MRTSESLGSSQQQAEWEPEHVIVHGHLGWHGKHRMSMLQCMVMPAHFSQCGRSEGTQQFGACVYLPLGTHNRFSGHIECICIERRGVKIAHRFNRAEFGNCSAGYRLTAPPSQSSLSPCKMLFCMHLLIYTRHCSVVSTSRVSGQL
jgi:hypothetical protein